jgi:hypothetical protein
MFSTSHILVINVSYLTIIMQDMITLAPDDTNELEVVFISTPNNHSLQVHSEEFLLSKGGSAPVELDDTASEDEE